MGTPKPNPWIESLAPYVAGRAKAAGVSKVVKLSSNESAVGASPKAVEAMVASALSLHLYPDPDSHDLRTAIGDAHGLDPKQIICGAGSDEILHLVAQAYVKPGDEIIHSRYGFMMYPIVAQSLGATPVAVANKDWAADVDGILAAVTDKTRLVYLDNPNNPTGAYLPKSEVERLIAGLPQTCVLVYDAAYAECVEAQDYTDGADLVAAHGNVLMTRTFSKLYGLAALRIGWGYGQPALLDPMNRIRMPFNANLPAQQAAIAAVRDPDHAEKARVFTIEWRKWLTAQLAALGLDVVPSQTNFVLIRFPKEQGFTAEEANQYLTERGYLLRWLPGQGLADCLRLTIGTEQENHAVIELLRAFMDRQSYPVEDQA
ncbi:histidinol-phosphate aminotransferase 2 [Iodidimonas gelatinilytica]|uniref:Histidinol-phosphate aminotransferase n=1 Tax=Iodidimonas gelatinilytica TaxID=1236966 RepID=A0A5A7MX31_9PROT|nr:histidinol-phosphate transaminase [Iodidimonas gelatinilytica]GEQ99588.1 histidinol-phosphate aminotransferase 2 [Iodidimonas gelatinilytica]